MKRAFFAFALVAALSFGAKADEKEFTGTVGCGKCNYSADTGLTACAAAAKIDGKVYLLKGHVAKDFKKGGEYVIKGTMAADGKTIEVKEMHKKA